MHISIQSFNYQVHNSSTSLQDDKVLQCLVEFFTLEFYYKACLLRIYFAILFPQRGKLYNYQEIINQFSKMTFINKYTNTPIYSQLGIMKYNGKPIAFMNF